MKTFAIILALVFVAFLFRCTSLGDQRGDVRYRIAVEVETPEGTKTGSGVIESRLIRPSWDFREYHDSLAGEAIPVDLGKAGTVYFTLAGNASSYEKAGRIDDKWDGFYGLWNDLLPTEAEMKKRCWGRIPFCRQTALSKIRKPVELPFDAHPLLVRFANEADPQSIEYVSPGGTAMTKAFGPGIYLRRTTIVPTSDRTTTGITKRLPWIDKMLAQYPGIRADGGIHGLTNWQFAPLPHQFYIKYLKMEHRP
ncbi:MAG: hypothetical protein ABL893_10910 [Hyphomicrobium sp.]|nr:hypothetical protein [Hyphomicrobium sp.]